MSIFFVHGLSALTFQRLLKKQIKQKQTNTQTKKTTQKNNTKSTHKNTHKDTILACSLMVTVRNNEYISITKNG